MNNIFMGSYKADGAIYDYCGFWSRKVAKVEWKAVVRKADVVCRPQGTIHDEPSDEDILRHITDAIETDIDQHRHGARRAPRLASG